MSLFLALCFLLADAIIIQQVPNNAIKNRQNKQKAVQNLSDGVATETGQEVKAEKLRSRSKFTCNPKLAEMIDEANLLPADFNFDFEKTANEKGFDITLAEWETILWQDLPEQTIEYIYEKALFNLTFLSRTYFLANQGQRYKIKTFSDIDKVLIEAHQFYKRIDVNRIGKLFDDESFKSFLLEIRHHNFQTEPYTFLYYTINPLIQLTETRNFLTNILKINTPGNVVGSRETALLSALFPHASGKSGESSLQEIKGELFSPNLINVREKLSETNVSLSEDGVIKFELSPFAEALQGVNISRLRTCEVCGRFFWASRADAYTCSKQHAETRKKRLQRENWKEKGHTGNGGYLLSRRKKNAKKKQLK
jgi:hypothetical protein